MSKAEWVNASNMSMIEGVLYHIWSPYPGAARFQTILQMVAPVSWRSKILKFEHGRARHYGAVATYDRIREKYWWPNMLASIKAYVDACEVCEAVKKPLGSAPMSYDIPLKFNQRVAMDPCGPFEESRNGNKYLIVVVECFSKWPVAFAVPNITSATVYKGFVDNYVYQFGPPEELVTDRGANMISELAMNLCNEFGIRKITTTAEHPQADPAERTIKTVKEVLRKVILEYGGDWDGHIPKVLAAMRWHKSNATKFSPYEVVFGRKPILPTYMELEPLPVENASMRALNEKKIGNMVKRELENQAPMGV